MSNGKQASARRLKMSERADALRGIHFPEFPTELLWHRKTNDGFITVPRTLPIAMHAIDANSDGHPAGHTLFCLWARSPDHPLINIENPATFAAEAGFHGVRAIDTWRRRMKVLEKHGFIVVKPGTTSFQYVLLVNPNAAVVQMNKKGLVQTVLYSQFYERVAEIGAIGELESIITFLELKQTSSESKKEGV